MLLTMVLWSIFSFAQTNEKITLQQAITMSIKNSKKLTIAHAKVDEANAAITEAKDRQLPDAKITGSYLRLSSANIDIKGAQGGGGSPNVNQALYGIANVTLPIYAGGKIKYGIESANYLAQAANLAEANDKEGIIYNTILAYTNLYKAANLVTVVKESLNAATKRDSTFSRLEQNGIIARNDLLKAQLQTSNIELTLLEAQSNLTVANINMNILLGLAENTIIEVDTNFIQIKNNLPSFIDLENSALQNRKDLQAIGFQKKAATIGIKAAKAEAYPTIALTGGYIAADIPKVISITNAVNIGLGVQYNLANLWKRNTKLSQAKAKQTQIDATALMLQDGIKLQLNKDFQNYLLAQKKIDVYEKAIIQSTENYRITKNKYDNNLVTITDLLDADVALLQSKLNMAVAKADVALAYNKILETTGTLSNNN
ncbi:TolC family protein [Ferruginibacter yonginensis]|uniref:TolC family protein n=1 Tax=Ferruginibacter yonginensis TaxID=1310416 RepID=A0ABV8QPV3_9BACT